MQQLRILKNKLLVETNGGGGGGKKEETKDLKEKKDLGRIRVF